MEFEEFNIFLNILKILKLIKDLKEEVVVSNTIETLKNDEIKEEIDKKIYFEKIKQLFPKKIKFFMKKYELLVSNREDILVAKGENDLEVITKFIVDKDKNRINNIVFEINVMKSELLFLDDLEFIGSLEKINILFEINNLVILNVKK
jgi:hypothetical protein